MRPSLAIQDCFGAGEMDALLPARAARAAWTFIPRDLPGPLLGALRDTATGDEDPAPELPISL